MSFYAIVDGKPLPAHPRLVGECPECATVMTPKCGDIIAWHWAHRPGSDCQYGNDGESGWHLWWKWQFHNAGGRIEVRYASETGRHHRADAVTSSGLVVEMQHDYQTAPDVVSREQAYDHMVWIYDAARFSSRLDHWADNGQIGFAWAMAAPSISRHCKPVLWHVGDNVWIVESLHLTRRPQGNGIDAVGTARDLGPAIELASCIDQLELKSMTIEVETDDRRLDVWGMPRCPYCGRPMTLGQPGAHYSCIPGTLAGKRCTCPRGCTDGDTWGDGQTECAADCEPCRLMAGRPYEKIR